MRPRDKMNCHTEELLGNDDAVAIDQEADIAPERRQSIIDAVSEHLLRVITEKIVDCEAGRSHDAAVVELQQSVPASHSSSDHSPYGHVQLHAKYNNNNNNNAKICIAQTLKKTSDALMAH